MEANPAGTVPMIKDIELGKLIGDSDAICDYLEEKYGPQAPVPKKALGMLADMPHP